MKVCIMFEMWQKQYGHRINQIKHYLKNDVEYTKIRQILKFIFT